MLSLSLANKFKKIKLFALDVDGVLTDGRVCLLPNGEEIKFFHIHDGHGLRQLMAAGFEIAIITGRGGSALEARMKELGIHRLYQHCQNKLGVLEKLCQTLKIELAETAFMGDDLPDSLAMEAAGIKITVPNAVASIKAIADYTTHLSGGNGAVREVCDLLLLAKESISV